MNHPSVFHPGPAAISPQQRLLLMHEGEWEDFIEECVCQLQKEGHYVEVVALGGSGDKGRDVCGYSKEYPEAGTWDLYQAKHYDSPLTPSEFFPELAKFVTCVWREDYTRPAKYFICASKDVGTTLFDLLKNPVRLKERLLDDWRKKEGKFGKFKQPLDADLEKFIEVFPFDVVKRLAPMELLSIHERDAASYWARFGVLAPRDNDPEVPPQPASSESTYVTELLRVYAEHAQVTVDDLPDIPPAHGAHFKAQRRLFYSAEGLHRFSRDKLPGAFEALLDEVENGIGAELTFPHESGFVRLRSVLQTANVLQIMNNPLRARLRSGDLQGSCHHLANQGRAQWVESDEADGESV